MLAKMLTDAIIESDGLPAERRNECMTIIAAKLASDPKLGAKFFDNEDARMLAFGQILIEVNSKMGLSDGLQRYSSTVYADSHDELKLKSRKVNIYASLGIISIFGFLGCFGYAIFLFYTQAGTPMLWAIIGVILFYFQKWVGKKHDKLTG